MTSCAILSRNARQPNVFFQNKKLKKMSEAEEKEVQNLVGEFIFPNGDEYNGEYISSENGIQVQGNGTWSSKKVRKRVIYIIIIYYVIL